MWRTRAYGLTLEGDAPILGLHGGAVDSGTRLVRIRVDSRQAADGPGWRALTTRRSGAFTIDRHARAGYRMHAPGYGAALISPDADAITVSPGDASWWRWQRYVLSQVLPFVAGLRGLELLHAAGVVLGDRAVALAGTSGCGKSTLAATLIDGGAEFLSDDVLALEATADGRVLAHPGPGLLFVREEVRSELAVHVIEGEAGEAAIAVGPRAATALGCVVVLERGDRPRVEALDPGDPRPLLTAAYETVRRDSKRLAGQLKILSHVAATARLLRLTVAGSPAETACTLREAL